jgi:predicted DCC family thiol-disulfide oxidoreductase YuxK
MTNNATPSGTAIGKTFPLALTTPGKVIVFYDGSCPLCRKENHHYIRRDHTGQLVWDDISKSTELLDEFGITLDEAMRRFHVIDRAGNVTRGAEAFLALWHALPVYQHLARTVEYLHLTPLLGWAYEHFARRRYRRACQRGFGNSCAIDTKKT